MRFFSAPAITLACGAALLCSACSGGTAATPTVSSVSSDLRNNDGIAVRPDSLVPPRRLAVAEWSGPSTFDGVAVLNRSYKQIRTITAGIHFPDSPHYDSKGNLYIANVAGADVTEYNKGGTLTFTYSLSGLVYPGLVSVDHHGNVYVGGGDGGYATSIVEYAQDSNTPLVSCPIGLGIGGLAVDHKGNVFVSVDPFKGSGAGMILEFKHGLSGCKPTTLGVQISFGGAGALEIDNHHNLVVSDRYVGVNIIPPPYTKVGSTITAGVNEFGDTALNKQNTLIYIVNFESTAAGNVVVDQYPSGTYVTTLGPSDGVAIPQGVAAYPL